MVRETKKPLDNPKWFIDLWEDAVYRRSSMVDYLNLKVREQDWHGVADAAMDLRDIDAEKAMLDQIAKYIK
jgi:hypothetical protein